MKRTRNVAAGVACLLLATGCSGPVAPLEVGMNTRSVNLLLGERVTVVTTQGPPPAVPVALPSDTGPLPLVPPPPPPPDPDLQPRQDDDPGPCPDASPTASYLNTATRTIDAPPAEATYGYRSRGVVTAGDEKIKLPAKMTRKVSDVRWAEDRSWLYDVITTVGDVTSRATYRIALDPSALENILSGLPGLPVPVSPELLILLVESATGVDVPVDGAGDLSAIEDLLPSPGVYLVRTDTPAKLTPTLSLPVDFEYPGLKLTSLPMQPGQSFHTAGTDGATTMSYTSTVSQDRPRVDACGDLIDAYQIDLEGTVSQPSETTGQPVSGDFTAAYAIAPQFGGLIVEETTRVVSDVASKKWHAVINRIPKDPALPPSGK